MAGRAVNIFEIAALNVRFITGRKEQYSHPSGFTVFEGVRISRSFGSNFGLEDGSLTVGDLSISVPDVNGTLTTWLAQNDTKLATIRVVQKRGTNDQTESSLDTIEWTFDDYAIENKGGGYILKFANVLKDMSQGLMESFDDEEVRLSATLALGATTASLEPFEDSAEAKWANYKYALLSDRRNQDHELVSYTGTTSTSLTGLTRAVFGVGPDQAWSVDDTDIRHVWAKRGNPLDIMLEFLTTQDTIANRQLVPNGNFEEWSGSVPIGWTLLDDGDVTYSKDTTDNYDGTASIKGIAGGGRDPDVYLSFTGILPARKYTISVAHKVSQGQAIVIVKNETTGHYLKSDGTWTLTTEFVMSSLTQTSWTVSTVTSANTPDEFSPSDEIFVRVLASQNDGESAQFDNAFLYLAKNSSYDQEDGMGIGMSADLIDITGIESVRDSEWPSPTFDGNGDKLTGTAILLVESRGIDDLKEFIEKKILRPFGLKPLLTSDQKFTVDTYFRPIPPEIDATNEWLIEDFNPSQWKRNYNETINVFKVRCDYLADRDKYVYTEEVQNATSIARYRKRKSVEIENRGGRTGRQGFPDYDTLTDINKAINRMALEVSNAGTQLKVKLFFKHRNVSMLNSVKVDVPSIPDLTSRIRGIVGRSFFVDSVSLARDGSHVEVTLRERRSILRSAIIAPGNVASTYSSASDFEKSYCYLTPNNDEQFSNGDEGYSVV